MPNKPPSATFHVRLFQAKTNYEGRLGQRLTQKELGEMVSVSQPTVADWEGGVRTPSLEQVELLAKALGVSPAWLAFNEGAMLAGHHDPPKVMPPGKRVSGETGSRKAR